MGDAGVRSVDYKALIFLASAHLLALVAVVYLAAVQFSWWTLGLAVLWLVLCGLSITGGYHRLFSHRSYRSRAPLRLFYLLFGAAAVQNSALKWSADHRRHHARTDQEDDPYSVTRGFWWAHIGWIVHKDSGVSSGRVTDLAADPLVMFQQRFYVPLAVLFGALLPAGIAALWGDPLGGLLVVGFLRLVVQYHMTFAINSVAHTIGSRPYNRSSSARDSFITAFLTLGEGYHNFHHRFPSDYRNGVRPHQFDPTKWWVWAMARLGLAWDLRRIGRDRIESARQGS